MHWLIHACCLLLFFAHSATRAEVVLKQADDSMLKLEAPVQRIITLSPHLAELVYAAGAGDLLLATVEYSEFPEEAAKLPRIGDAFRIDVEGIVASRPDLVVAWESGNPKAAVTQLRTLGLAVWSVEIREPEQIAQTLRAIGLATGRKERSERLAGQLDRRLDQLGQHYANVRPLDYFYQVAERPLFTINGDHLISKGLALCGGHNIFREETGLAFQVAREAVITANPDAMFAPYAEGMEDPFKPWLDWPGLKSVRAEAMFRLPADAISRATPRWLDSLELACTLLHGLREQITNE